METSIIEEIFLPWWRGVVYLLAIALTVVGIRLIITFDLNRWLEQRRADKDFKESVKESLNCRHVWTYYPSSLYSSCTNCPAFIDTSILAVGLAAKDANLLIAGTRLGQLTVSGRQVFVTSYVGKKE